MKEAVAPLGAVAAAEEEVDASAKQDAGVPRVDCEGASFASVRAVSERASGLLHESLKEL